MPSARKKVIVRLLSRASAAAPWIAGYIATEDIAPSGNIEILDLAGKTVSLQINELKWLCFVRDFSSGDPANPERLLSKTFPRRPRTGGLWLRIRLRDGDELEGLAANDVSLVSSSAIFISPPDIRSNTQRIWIPHTAIAQFEVLAVIGGAAPRKPLQPATLEQAQLQQALFPASE